MVCLTLIALLAAPPQDSVRVRATLTTDRVVAGESTVLEIVVETDGASPESIRLPALPGGVEVLGSQDFSQFQVRFPGGRTRVTGRSMVLAGRNPGSYTIPPVLVTVGGRVYRTSPLPLVVTAAATGAPGRQARDRVRLVAQLEPAQAYVGQQVNFKAEAVFPRELRQRQTRPATYQAPSPAGFWAQDLPDPLIIGLRTTGDEVYETQTFRRAYFPLVPGRHVFPPARLSYELRTTLGTPPEPRELASDSMVIEVRPLPEQGRPASFTGAVGRFTVRAAIEPRVLGVHDAATLTVDVSGTGNVKALPSPQLPQIDGLEVFAPAENAQPSVKSDQIGGSKRFSWVVVARAPGRIAIPPIEYAFFDPTAETFVRIRTDSLALEVTGSIVAVDPVALRPISGRTFRHPLRWVDSRLFLALQIVPLLLVLIAWRTSRPPVPDRKRAVQRSDRFRALAAEALAAEATFWGRLSEAVRSEIAISTGQGEVRTAAADRVLELLLRAHVPRATAAALSDLLDNLDRARFAPGAAWPADAPSIVARAERLLAAMEASLGRRAGRHGRAALAVVALALPGALAGRAAQDDFGAGVRAFIEGRYAPAAAAFASHLEGDPADANAWYNAGNAYIRAGDRGRAVHAWLTAVRLRRRHLDARHNLALVSAEAGSLMPAAWWPEPVEARFALALIWWVGAAVAAIRLRRRRPAARVVATAAVLMAAAALAGLRGNRVPAGAVSLVEGTAVLAEPVLKGEPADRIPAGSVVRVLDRRAGWLRVRTAAGTEGWVATVDFAELGPTASS